MTDLENKLNGAKGQLVYWSRRVDQLTKQIKERDNAARVNNGVQPERKGVLVSRPAREKRMRDGGASDVGNGTGA